MCRERLRLSAAASCHSGETRLDREKTISVLFTLLMCVCVFVSDGECVPGVSTLLLPVPGQYPGG